MPLADVAERPVAGFRPIGREAVIQPERLEVHTPEVDPFAHLPRTQSLIPEEVRLIRASFHNIHELNARHKYMQRVARSERRSQSLSDPPAARADVPDARARRSRRESLHHGARLASPSLPRFLLAAPPNAHPSALMRLL